jgi:hypothetical protein
MGRRKKYCDEAVEEAVKAGIPVYPNPEVDRMGTVYFIGMEEPKPKKWSLQKRYEHWTANGKEFTRWFEVKDSDDKKELTDYKKTLLSLCVTHKTKLKEEYQIVENS